MFWAVELFGSLMYSKKDLSIAYYGVACSGFGANNALIIRDFKLEPLLDNILLERVARGIMHFNREIGHRGSVALIAPRLEHLIIKIGRLAHGIYGFFNFLLLH